MITKDFLEAGHAIFTVSNPVKEHYTYRVTKPKDFNESYPVWFVSLLTGPNNTEDYTYLGILTNSKTVKTTAKSKFAPDSKAVKVVQWAVKQIYDGAKLPEGYNIQHVGRCGVCGRPLTTPESIESGIGPICAGR
jgi:hypothetical protein